MNLHFLVIPAPPGNSQNYRQREGEVILELFKEIQKLLSSALITAPEDEDELQGGSAMCPEQRKP